MARHAPAVRRRHPLLFATRPQWRRRRSGPARRIDSMVVITRIRRDRAKGALVGVDEFSARAEPAAAALPRVGGLYSPSLEAVVALEPDLVVLVPSLEQREFRARLSSLSLSVREFDPVRFEQVLETIRELGRLVGRETEATARVDAIRRAQDAVQRAIAGRAPLRAVLVLQREPLFVAGRGSFLDEMLAMAGARNLGAELAEVWPRTSVEWLVAAGPR
jgi:iron complex transport system substrate-binding protein